MGYDFHRQKPIDNYIADFFCHDLKLVIEIDGYSHSFGEVAVKDLQKEAAFEELGLTVIRFDDREVMDKLNSVLKAIENYIADFEEKKSA
jgi:very-short-patch-repair endonuclease